MNSHQFQAYLKEKKRLVEGHMQILINQMEISPSSLRSAMEYSLFAGGKRIRPILLLATVEDTGMEIAGALDAACALEFLHTYSLIHDDLPAMDDDEYRRGKLTNHMVYGEALAILAGDALLTEAFGITAKADLAPETKVALLAELAIRSGSRGMVAGQVLDLEAEEHSISLEELELVHRHKTGDLITYAVWSGAVIARSNKEELPHYSQYAKSLGLAFQIQDDILDVIGDEAKLGKKTGGDEKLQKSTYVSLLGLNGARQKLHETLEQARYALRQLRKENGLLWQFIDYMEKRDS